MKKIYGIQERQFAGYVRMAHGMTGNTGENLLSTLESRLDNIVFRLGFAKTRPQACQYVSHGLFLLNGRRVDIPSILVQPGDVIEPRKREQLPEIPEKPSATWLELDEKSLKGKVLHLPSGGEVDIPVDISLVLQFYTR